MKSNDYFMEHIVVQHRLRKELDSLYDLLEEFGPCWYEKRHHDEAERALQLPVKILQTKKSHANSQRVSTQNKKFLFFAK